MAAAQLGLLGLHKFLRYKSWFKNELADYVRQSLASPQTIANGFWNPALLQRLATRDQFAIQKLLVRNADLLCAPTRKVAWERVQ